MTVPTHNNPGPCLKARDIGGTWLSVACCLLLIGPIAQALGAEIHSNGRGGGAWSEPGTWHGGEVPGPDDVVVIAMRDRVIFDQNDRDQRTCGALFLDPESVLSFEEGSEGLALTVAGPIDAYGTIRIDGTRDGTGNREIRLVGTQPEQRRVRLREHGGLLLYGDKQAEDDGRQKVRLIADAAGSDATAQPVQLTANDKAMVDLRHSDIRNIRIELADLDNSGGARERLNIIGSRMTGNTTIRLERCDTPVVRDNHFQTYSGASQEIAIESIGSRLGQFRGNTIEGPYAMGMVLKLDNNSTVADTRIDGAMKGGVVLRKCIDTSLQHLSVRGAGEGEGVSVSDSREGVLLEQVRVENADRGYRFEHSRAQLTDCSAQSSAVAQDNEAWAAIGLLRSSLRLINTPFAPDLIDIEDEGAPPGGEPFIETMQYVIVRVTPSRESPDSGDDVGARQPAHNARGEAKLPKGLRVRLQTAEASGGVPAKGADLNVRNSPVPVGRTGMTPLPRSQHALIVRSWRIDREQIFQQAPFYELTIDAPALDGSDARRALVRQTVEPRAGWFRREPNEPEPTIEVSLP